LFAKLAKLPSFLTVVIFFGSDFVIAYPASRQGAVKANACVGRACAILSTWRLDSSLCFGDG